MTIIVKHRRTSREYILLGINGEVTSVNPSRLINELFNQEKSQVSCTATICDIQGNILIADIVDLRVIEIAGQKLGEILPKPSYESPDNDFDQEQINDWEDDEELGIDPAEADNSSEVPVGENLGSSAQENLDDDDEDWI
ncbi:MAG: hypothetical protein AAFQ80_02040 [Cyanobacteria bacterium J06621_8]